MAYRAPLTELKVTAGFHRQGYEEATLGHTPSPDHFIVSQIQALAMASPDGPLSAVAFFKPNLEIGIKTGYGSAPIRTAVTDDGRVGIVSTAFPRRDHPLAHIDIKTGDYQLDVNPETRVVRAVVHPTPHASADYNAANAYFATSNGKELTDLATEAGYRFRNVVALSDSLYFTEVGRGSPRGQAGDVVIFDYDPARFIFHRLTDYERISRDEELAAELMRVPANRAVAQGAVLANGNVEVTTQTHSFIFETPEAMMGRPSGVRLSPLINRGSSLVLAKIPKDINYGKNEFAVKVFETQFGKGERHYEMSVTTRSRADQNGARVHDTFVTLHQSSIGLEPRTWKISGSEVAKRAYRVKGGFVIQRAGYNSRPYTEPGRPDPLPQGFVRGMVFLMDSGEVREIRPLLQAIGEIAISNGHVFFIEPGGQALSLLYFPEWR